MAIRILKTDKEAVNVAIHASCEMIYDIEDLLVRGPKQMEAYGSLLKILKDMKRGCSMHDSISRNAVQGCPPGMTSSELCERITCQSCWEEYIRTFLEKAKEKEKKHDISDR